MALYLVPVEQGRPIVLDKAVVFIGRHPECDVVLKASRKVSRKHCCIAQVDSRIVVRDLGSMNGVRLNGERVQHEATVRLGDEVTIGDVGYILQTHDAAGRQRGPKPPNGQQAQARPQKPPTRPPRRDPSDSPLRPEPPPLRPEPPSRAEPPSCAEPPSRREKPLINRPLALSQDVPVPIPEEDADFRVEDSQYRHELDARRGDESGSEDDVVVLSDSDEL